MHGNRAPTCSMICLWDGGRAGHGLPAVAEMVVEHLGSWLHLCSKTGALRLGLSLHSVVLKCGQQSDVVVCNHVVNMYAKCHDVGSARKLFDEMTNRNIVSWSAMISGYDQAGMPAMALEMFARMELCPNEYVYASVINSCSSLLAVAAGKQIHGHSIKTGYEHVSFVSNSLISLYMDCGLPDDGLSIFSRMDETNLVAYNTAIAGLAENLQFERGLEHFKVMQRREVGPDRFTFAGLFESCSGMEDLRTGSELHCLAVKLGFSDTAFVGNLILTMYYKCDLSEAAERVFSSIEDKDIVSWNAYIAACSHCGDHTKALRVFGEVQNDNIVKPDDFTYSIALAACGNIASLHYGGQVHAHLVRTRVELDVGVSNALLHMYAKCGFIAKAKLIFDHVVHRNLVSWNTIIAGYSNNGYGRECLQIFEQMKARGIKPDSLTFLGLLSGCRHAGLLEEGWNYFNSMKEIHGINPGIEQFSCLIDLLGKAGRLQEAEEYLKNSSFRNDLVALGCLLSACTLHGNIGVGERVGKRILQLQPGTSSPYVLLSNLYSSGKRWEDVAASRKMLKGSPVKKTAGYSLIEIRGLVEKFTVGDLSHSRALEVQEVLKLLRSPCNLHA